MQRPDVGTHILRRGWFAVGSSVECRIRSLPLAVPYLSQYFGYLRRNPNDAPEPGLNFDGYNFWLNKLDQFNGNFVAAEMVKAFITSGEYRQRFGS